MAAMVWFRDDLRLDDHLALQAALRGQPESLAFVHVFDPRLWSTARGIGLPLARLGPHRAQFWRESAAALRVELRRRGAELLVRVGDPVEVIPELAKQVDAETVYAQGHVAEEELLQESEVAQRLGADGRRLELNPGRTLIHVEDLPFPVDQLPDVFTKFRKKVEARPRIRAPIDAPAALPSCPAALPCGDIPNAEDMGTHPPSNPSAGALLTFSGGEASAREHFDRWAFEAGALGAYKETRNGLLTAEDSSKISPWLAAGCLSPRRVWAEIERYEAERGANESTYWLGFELLWRDYFAFLSLRERARLFKRSGVGRRNLTFSTDRERFESWADGRTGFPFVDAFMRELQATGFMSNRGRQNVASFLAKTLGVDWRWGAAWFEHHLVDFDPATNWGNWQYAAGVGTDPRDRVFNVVKQAHDYDPEGAFVRRWVPELSALTGGRIHTPWREPISPDYPDPIVPPLSRGGRR